MDLSDETQQPAPGQDDEGLYSSRSFALGLIGIASLYVLIMICQAYKSNQLRMILSDSQGELIGSGYYEYETESYDFDQYQSQGTDNNRMLNRGFQYNESIGASSEVSD